MKLYDIIKYEGDNQTFIWKHPCEDFNLGTQLIVHESQEAIFFMNGQALDLFGPGRHALTTQNLPIIGKALNIPTDGKTPFHCEVYFINKVEQMAIKWGTNSRVQYMDPSYGFPLSIGACGEMSLRAEDSRKILIKIVGTEKGISQQMIVSKFQAFLNTKIKSYIALFMKSNKVSIFEIDEHLETFSVELREKLYKDFIDYGVSLEKFLVTSISKPDGEPQYEKFKSLHFRKFADIQEAKIRQEVEIIGSQTEAQKTVIQSEAMARKRAQEGYTYQQERGYDVASKIAENEAVGQFNNIGVGLGMMAGVGGTVGKVVGGTINDALNTNQTQVSQSPNPAAAFCPNCGAQIVPGSPFCGECGNKLTEDKPTCVKCGYVFTKLTKFCPKCGTKRGE